MCAQIKRLEDKLATEMHSIRVEAAAFSTRSLEKESAQDKRTLEIGKAQEALSVRMEEALDTHLARLERLERLASDAAAAARPAVRPIGV